MSISDITSSGSSIPTPSLSISPSAITDPVSSFKSSKFVDGSKDFLNSNSIVAKFAFLILIVIVFLFLLRAFVGFMGWVLAPSGKPYLSKGLSEGRTFKIVEVDPGMYGSKPILRSNNQRKGIEFTWSVWVYIDNLEYKQGQYKHIFHKGNDSVVLDGGDVGLMDGGGINYPFNSPGLYIGPDKNTLVVFMNTFSENKILERIEIEDIPIKKWFNVMIRNEGRNFDVFINGTIVKRLILKTPPRQNYGKVYISQNGGFAGYNSNLRYFNYALGTRDIQSIVDSGPNLKGMDDNTPFKQTMNKYLSMRWYFYGN